MATPKKPRKGDGPGRPRLFTDEQLDHAIRTTNNLHEAALELGCDDVTMRRHAKRLGLVQSSDSLYEERSEYTANQFFGRRTISHVAKITGQTRSTVGRQIKMWVLRTWQNRHHPAYGFAIPQRNADVKIVQSLLREPDLFDDPDEIARQLKMTAYYVREYVAKSYDRMMNIGRKSQRYRKPPAKEDVRFVGRRAKKP